MLQFPIYRLTDKEFNELPEYSRTLPTGKTIGKHGNVYGEIMTWILIQLNDRE